MMNFLDYQKKLLNLIRIYLNRSYYFVLEYRAYFLHTHTFGE